jgi:glycosyltransferase involved in cell wall biosynthesis
VNDGSKDRTAAILNELENKLMIRVIHLPINLGIGGAVQTGFQVAEAWSADVTLQIDGDGQHPVVQMNALVAPILEGRAEVVVGSRYISGSGGNVSSRSRRVGTWLFSILLRLITGVKIQDTTSGFRAFSKNAAKIISKDYADDYPEVEAYVPLARQGFKIIEVPVKMRPRLGGSSSITVLKGAYYMLKVMFSTVLDLSRPLSPSQKSRVAK